MHNTQIWTHCFDHVPLPLPFCRYCHRLPHDDYTKLAPFFEVVKMPKDRSSGSEVVLFGGEEDEDEDPKHDYICTVTLPINCPIKAPVKVSNSVMSLVVYNV